MDLDISPWSDGSSFASVVKGKARGHVGLCFDLCSQTIGRSSKP